ncbi:hypothetical protein [Tepidibacillus fermentans]|uniref:Uncharacterized protein n=1 Tax=Tepidibacillus fermentans TaxID=1281767 RepID=A0A4R3KIN3_9BACI|nr:hypothetical protein [Tepidibacillus fermentans]TCS82541.1 hypothetical protein EDD72_10830 [Tepidibacillus fermentans]
MFDPTIFDNIKVILEGRIYDLDLEGKIIIVQRNDWVDLARMSRKYRIQFRLLAGNQEETAEVTLSAGTEDLTMEILEIENENKPGCEISIRFYTVIENPDQQCKHIEEKINQIWNYRPILTQTIHYIYPNTGKMNNEILLQFGRKIDEDNIEDIPELIEYTLKTLEALSLLNKK